VFVDARSTIEPVKSLSVITFTPIKPPIARQ